MSVALDKAKDEPDVKVLCSSCFDQMGNRILAIIPQQTCDICGKRCLGYQTVLEKR